MISSCSPNHPRAVINIASAEAIGDRTKVPCSFQNLEGKRLTVQSSEKLALSTTVSVEYNDALFLGEVMNCSRQTAEGWQVEIKVEQILTGLQSLMALRSQLLGEGANVSRQAVALAA